MLPEQFSKIELPIKWYLASYRACTDCKYGIHKLQKEPTSFFDWKVEWAGICSLLRASIHLMDKDAKSCMPKKLRDELVSVWDRIKRDRSQHKIFWEFIYKERNNILKQYDFSAYAALLLPDGTIRERRSLLHAMSDGEKETLIIRGGEYDGRLALDVALEAAEWIESTILNAIKAAGYDPEQKVISEFFVTAPPHQTLPGLLGDAD